MKQIAGECKDYDAFLKRFFPAEWSRKQREREMDMKGKGKGGGKKKGGC